MTAGAGTGTQSRGREGNNEKRCWQSWRLGIPRFSSSSGARDEKEYIACLCRPRLLDSCVPWPGCAPRESRAGRRQDEHVWTVARVYCWYLVVWYYCEGSARLLSARCLLYKVINPTSHSWLDAGRRGWLEIDANCVKCVSLGVITS